MFQNISFVASPMVTIHLPEKLLSDPETIIKRSSPARNKNKKKGEEVISFDFFFSVPQKKCYLDDDLEMDKDLQQVLSSLDNNLCDEEDEDFKKLFEDLKI